MSHAYSADEAAAAALLTIPQAPPETPYIDPQPLKESFVEEPPVPPPAPEREVIPEFDPKHRQPFLGLLYVGSLVESFSLYGHDFVISTPTQTELLQIGQVIEPFAMTPTVEVAYQTARVAAYLVSIDGQKLPEPVLNDPKETALHDRFRWVSDNIRRPVIDKIFDRCLELDNKVKEALEAMGKASG